MAGGDGPALYNLYCKSNGHRLLNELTTADLARKYPHNLPDSYLIILSLSATNEGIQVMQKMMKEQPMMVTLMNGYVLTRRENHKNTILSLLCTCEEGISILHQLLDVQQNDLVRWIGKNLTSDFSQGFKELSAYEKLSFSMEGRRFLDRLRCLGWQPLGTQNPYFFFDRKAKEPVNLLLSNLAAKNTEKVKSMVRADPGLLLAKGNIEKDGILHKGVTPVEFCKTHQDIFHIKEMMSCLDDSIEGQNIKAIVFPTQRLFELM